MNDIPVNYEKFWSVAFDTTGDIVFLVDSNFNIVRANEAFLSLCGKSQAELAGRKCYELVHGAGKPIDACPHARLLLSGKFEQEEIYEAGLGKWFNVQTTPIFDSGRLVGSIHVAINVSAQKTAQAEVKQAKDYAQLLYSLTPSAVFTTDTQRRITSWNRRAEEITGYSEAEVLGRNCVFFAKDPCKENCGVFSPDVKKPILAMECTIEDKYGRIRIISKNANELRDENGNVIGAIESFEDVTDLREVTSEKDKLLYDIRERIKEMRCLYAVSKIAMQFGTDIDSFFSEAARIIPSGLQFPDSACCRITFGEKIFTSKDFQETDVHCKLDIKVRDTLVGKLDVFYPPVKPDGSSDMFLPEELDWLVAVSDRLSGITQRIMAEEELADQTENLQKSNEAINELYQNLEKKNEELQKLDKLKTDFISTVSHELRTPLTAIREVTSQLLDKVVGDITPQQERFLGICLRNIDRLKRIIDTLLDIAKIEAGRMELHRERVDMKSLAQGVMTSLGSYAQKKGLELKSSFDASGLSAYCDHDKMVGVLTNLVGNAIKFTEKGHIEIGAKADGETLECWVSDTGKGIAAEDIPKLFGKFQQIGRVEGAGEKGTGLGLSICKGIVEMHGGKIWAESLLGSGARFAFTVPAYSGKSVLLANAVGVTSGALKNQDEFVMLTVRFGARENLLKIFGEAKIFELFSKMAANFRVNFKQIISALAVEDGMLATFAIKEQDMDMMAPAFIKMVKSSLFVGGCSKPLDFSWGYASYPNDGQDASSLLDQTMAVMRAEGVGRMKKKILLVDDEPQVLNSLRRLLEALGYANISQASSGEEALEKLRASLPDLMISDMQMPGMSGYELIGRLKAESTTKNIPVLIMSGFEVDKAKISQYIVPSEIVVISKPFDVEQVNRLLYYFL